jgi:hypothetical protein
MSKKSSPRDKEMREDDELDDEQKAEQLERTTEEIEAEKERRRFEREEKKFLKEHAKKSKARERFIAPLLLILTILISYIIFLLRQ